MQDQIECVGGPLDGNYRPRSREGEFTFNGGGFIYNDSTGDQEVIKHIYHYDPSSNKYIYKGVD
jgi:hypothetical protein